MSSNTRDAAVEIKATSGIAEALLSSVDERNVTTMIAGLVARTNMSS